jgi:hypothetical protein
MDNFTFTLPSPIDDDECGAVDGMKNWQGKPKYFEDAYPTHCHFVQNKFHVT